jgi:hypothetical protein
MTDVQNTGTKMINLPCTAIAINEGYMYTEDGGGQMELQHVNTHDTIAVGAYDSLDVQTGASAAKVAGDHHAFYLIGSGAIVNMANEVTHTWQFGDLVTAGTTTTYLAAHDASGATHVGHYIGIDNTQFTVGQLIKVVLDIPIGTR